MKGEWIHACLVKLKWMVVMLYHIFDRVENMKTEEQLGDHGDDEEKVFFLQESLKGGIEALADVESPHQSRAGHID